MLDPKIFRNNLEQTAENLRKRGFELNCEMIQELESQRKILQLEAQKLQSQRNLQSKAIGIAKAKGEDIKPLLDQVADLGDQIKVSETKYNEVQTKLLGYCMNIPNLPDDSVPVGKNENDNVEIRKWGTLPEFDFMPKEHTNLGEDLKYMDFETATKITGSRFVILKSQLARLHRALIQFMLDIHINEHGYEEIYVPYLVNKESLVGTSQLPKFKEDQFEIKDWDYALIPTAEVPVTNTVRDVILKTEQLPLKYVCHSPCFRSEAGSYGKDTKGMIRQHQFEKVEMVQIVHPETSFDALEEITKNAEAILQRLELPYRVLALCTGDMGFSATKTYDLEVWMPGQDNYREISSCSNTLDFQARRMQARFRSNNNKPELLHTLNGSGLAVGRCMIAIMENYQQVDGSIKIPGALIPYMGGLTVITK